MVVAAGGAVRDERSRAAQDNAGQPGAVGCDPVGAGGVPGQFEFVAGAYGGVTAGGDPEFSPERTEQHAGPETAGFAAGAISGWPRHTTAWRRGMSRQLLTDYLGEWPRTRLVSTCRVNLNERHPASAAVTLKKLDDLDATRRDLEIHLNEAVPKRNLNLPSQ